MIGELNELRIEKNVNIIECVIVKTCSDSLFTIGKKTVRCLLRSYTKKRAAGILPLVLAS